ncbi:hypothetical protein [Intestinicryptomonas porci]|uniref:Transposase n=1 Tax=Intestinicryptomonas porci TaxID=2926320 RepID=A0ABU4WEM5_9BACT|nr:hypothetical protein [Opitutales bacterium CLA-KB-P66]
MFISDLSNQYKNATNKFVSAKNEKTTNLFAPRNTFLQQIDFCISEKFFSKTKKSCVYKGRATPIFGNFTNFKYIIAVIGMVCATKSYQPCKKR